LHKRCIHTLITEHKVEPRLDLLTLGSDELGKRAVQEPSQIGGALRGYVRDAEIDLEEDEVQLAEKRWLSLSSQVTNSLSEFCESYPKRASLLSSRLSNRNDACVHRARALVTQLDESTCDQPVLKKRTTL